jgi:hypothetical protein
MAISPEQFWGSNYYNHPPLTEELIAIAQGRLGVKLPEEYITLLRIQNGGYTQGFGYPMNRRTTWSEDHVPLHDLFGIITDPGHRTAQNILATEYMIKEWGLPPQQVLLSGEGHWWISLDYRAGACPSVAWLAIESGEDFQIAPSFAAFLEGLVPNSAFGGEQSS